MTNKDFFRLRDGLKAVGKFSGVKFAYAVARNLRIVQPICDDLEKTIAPSEEYIAFERARTELAKQHANKDENGKPIIDGNRIPIADLAAFERDFAELVTKHDGVVTAHQKKLTEYERLLGESVETPAFYKIKLDLVPEPITADQLDAIFEVVEE